MPPSLTQIAQFRRALVEDIRRDAKGWLQHGVAALAVSVLGLGVAGAVTLTGCMFVAGEIGLVDLIASGYRFLAWLFLAVFVLPLITIGTWRLLRPSTTPHMEALS